MNRGGWGVTLGANTFTGTQTISGNLALILNTSTISLGVSSDVILARDAANTLALRNGTAAQTFNFYNTYTDASNYERVAVGAGVVGANTTGLIFSVAGTGTQRDVYLGSTGAGAQSVYLYNNGARWAVNPSGHFIAGSDNAYDIGASGATRPRNVFVAANVVVGGKLSAISTGAAQVTGNAVLVGGTVTVATTAALTASKIMLTRKTSGGTPGTSITYTISNAVSFTITSDNVLDTSTFTWFIIDSY